MSENKEGIRELFIEELAEVNGGGSKIIEWIRDQLNTTYACGEEGPGC